jgi:hypothetical protein
VKTFLKDGKSKVEAKNKIKNISNQIVVKNAKFCKVLL